MVAADNAAMTYIVMLMFLLKPQDSTAKDLTDKQSAACLPTHSLACLLTHLLTSLTDKHLSSRDVIVSPPAPQLMFVGTRMTVSIVVTSAVNSSCDRRLPTCDVSDLVMSVSFRRPMTVVALPPDHANGTLTELSFQTNHSIALVVRALSVGRAVLIFEISSATLATDSSKIAMSTDTGLDIRYTAVHNYIDSSHSVDNDGGRRRVSESKPSHLLAVIEYHITVARHRRLIDDGFFWAVAAATLLNAFSLGCVTVYNDVKTELRKLQSLVLATLLCQFVILPPVR